MLCKNLNYSATINLFFRLAGFHEGLCKYGQNFTRIPTDISRDNRYDLLFDRERIARNNPDTVQSVEYHHGGIFLPQVAESNRLFCKESLPEGIAKFSVANL